MPASVGGLAGTAWQAVRAEREAIRAEREASRAAAEAAAAGEVTEFLVGLFEASDPYRAPAGPPATRQLLERGAERLGGGELELADVARPGAAPPGGRPSGGNPRFLTWWP